MTRPSLYASATRWTLFAVLAAAPLVACSPSGQSSASSAAPSSAVDLATGPAQPIAPAPPASALPLDRRIPVGRLSDPDEDYAFADQAYAQNDAFGDAPPDYGFDYGGTQPWVWHGDDGSYRVTEPLPGGGDRYYYYAAGASYPYLVRDSDYSYGYRNGQLVVIYDHAGHALPYGQYEARQDFASRVFDRGLAMFGALQHQPHQPVAQANWTTRRTVVDAEQSRWAASQASDPAWASYHAAHAPQEQSQYSAERAKRETQAAQFAQSINDPKTAARDQQRAQEAQARAQGAPSAAPAFGPHPAAAPVAAKTEPPRAGQPGAMERGGERGRDPGAGAPVAAPTQPTHPGQPGAVERGGELRREPGAGAAPTGTAVVKPAEGVRPQHAVTAGPAGAVHPHAVKPVAPTAKPTAKPAAEPKPGEEHREDRKPPE